MAAAVAKVPHVPPGHLAASALGAELEVALQLELGLGPLLAQVRGGRSWRLGLRALWVWAVALVLVVSQFGFELTQGLTLELTLGLTVVGDYCGRFGRA